MKEFYTPISRQYKKTQLTGLQAYQCVLCTEVELLQGSDVVAKMLLAEAPDWVRQIINVNRSNFVDLKRGAK